jgi:hypothetical protein
VKTSWFHQDLLFQILNLCRYDASLRRDNVALTSEVADLRHAVDVVQAELQATADSRERAEKDTVGLYKLRVQSTHSLPAPGLNPCTYQAKVLFQSLRTDSACTATARTRASCC